MSETRTKRLPQGELLTVEQVAAEAGYHKQHVYDLIAKGLLPAVNFGLVKRPSYRVTRVAFDTFLQARETAAGRQPKGRAKTLRQVVNRVRA
jgi:excisionase family DNA binding protein